MVISGMAEYRDEGDEDGGECAGACDGPAYTVCIPVERVGGRVPEAGLVDGLGVVCVATLHHTDECAGVEPLWERKRGWR